MKKLFRPYLSLFLASTLVFATAACGNDDDPKPVEEEQELITTLQISLVPEGKGQNVTATFRDANALNGPTNETLSLAPNTTYKASVTLKDESKTPAVDYTSEINEEGDEHEVFYVAASGLNVTVQKTEDKDKNDRPIGLLTKVVTGQSSAGTLRITLKHQPNLKGNTSDSSKGETDVEVNFNVVIQ